MSTYFFLTCRTCRQYAALASRSGDGVGGLAGDEWLRPFAVVHVDHDTKVMSEYSEELESFDDIEGLCRECQPTIASVLAVRGR